MFYQVKYTFKKHKKNKNYYILIHLLNPIDIINPNYK